LLHTSRLQRRGHVYHYRRRVPYDLRPVLASLEIVRSLRTRSAPEACKIARRLDDQVEALFTIARSSGVEPEEAQRLIEELVDDWIERWIQEDRQSRRREQDLSEVADNFHLIAQDEAEALDEGRILSHIQREADELITQAGAELDEEQRHALAWELARANIRLLREMAEERRRDLRGESRTAAGTQLSGETSQAEPRRKPRMTVGKALEAFIREHTDRAWSPRYKQIASRYLERFTQHIGGPSIDLAAIAKQNVVAFREALRETGITEVTVRKHMNAVVAFLRFCEAFEWIDQSPAENLPGGLAQKDMRSPDQLREVVMDADLEKILGCGSFRAMRNGDDLAEERYWALIMLAYTGARRAEVTQAWVKDIREADGVWCLRIEPSDDPEIPKRVKTKASARMVPLHRDLLQLGLVDFVRQAKGKRLFPRVARSDGELLSKWWRRQRERVKASPGAQIHGLRHRVTTQLKHADVAEDVISEVLGHSQRSLAMGRYGKRSDVVRLARAIELIDNRGPLAYLFS
jgi:integrase